jgi:Arc/MetJ-type ribon-helix-helix transcriptional regulator
MTDLRYAPINRWHRFSKKRGLGDRLDPEKNKNFMLTKQSKCITLYYGGNNMNQTLTIRIPKSMRNELQEISKIEKKSVSDLVRESLQKYLAVQRFRKLRNTVLPFAEAQGILTDEDVFDQLS